MKGEVNGVMLNIELICVISKEKEGEGISPSVHHSTDFGSKYPPESKSHLALELHKIVNRTYNRSIESGSNQPTHDKTLRSPKALENQFPITDLRNPPKIPKRRAPGCPRARSVPKCYD